MFAALAKKAATFASGVGTSIAQELVNGVKLVLDQGHISNVKNGGFTLALKGSLLDTGYSNSTIEFLEPVNISWEGHRLAFMTLPTINTIGGRGVPDWQISTEVTIVDVERFAEFTKHIVHHPEFTWVITASRLRVSAFGATFDDVTLDKTVVLKAFNKLSEATLLDVKLTEAAEGSIVEGKLQLRSPAQLAVTLDWVEFALSYEDNVIGTLVCQNLLLPVETELIARISGALETSAASSEARRTFIAKCDANEDIPLMLRCRSIRHDANSAPVSWITFGFETLDIVAHSRYLILLA